MLLFFDLGPNMKFLREKFTDGYLAHHRLLGVASYHCLMEPRLTFVFVKSYYNLKGSRMKEVLNVFSWPWGGEGNDMPMELFYINLYS